MFEVGKKCVGFPPPPPPLSDFFRARAKFWGSRSSSETFCPPPPLSKHPGAAPAPVIYYELNINLKHIFIL